MAATTSETSYGRVAIFGGNVTAIPITVGANGSTYAAASGGLPIDLSQALAGGVALASGAGQFSQPYINPGDVVGFQAIGLSTNGFLPTNLVIGTPTYGPAAYPFNGGSQNAIHPVNQLLTCPATIQLRATGAASNAAFGQVADGVNNDSFVGLLLIARGGTNA